MRRLWSPSPHPATVYPSLSLSSGFVIYSTFSSRHLCAPPPSAPQHLSLSFSLQCPLVLFLLTCHCFSLPPFLPVAHISWFFSPSLSSPAFSLCITPARSRNRAGCQLDELKSYRSCRPRYAESPTGPASRSLSVPLSPSASLSHSHAKWVQSNLALRTALTLLCNADVKGFHTSAIKKTPYQASTRHRVSQPTQKHLLLFWYEHTCERHTSSWPESASSKKVVQLLTVVCRIKGYLWAEIECNIHDYVFINV